MAAKKSELQKILDLAGEFVMKQEGAWEHADWESFLNKAVKAGVSIDDEGKRNLGNILEASKYFYGKGGGAPAPEAVMAKASSAKRPAKKKAAAKKKTAAKKGAKKE